MLIQTRICVLGCWLWVEVPDDPRSASMYRDRVVDAIREAFAVKTRGLHLTDDGAPSPLQPDFPGR